MMNTLHKSLTIVFLAVFIFVSGLSADLVSAQNSTPELMVTLTPEEKAWIKAHSTITLSITNDIPPRSFIDKDGKIKGTTVDYVRLFEQKLGLRINLVGSDWATALKRALDHEVDGVLQAAELEKRKPYLNFTQVYSYTPQAVIAGDDEPTISGLDALCGRSVGVIQDSPQSRYLMKHFPCINVVHFKALEQVAYALAGGEIHAVFGNYDYYASILKQTGLVGFKAIYLEYLPPTGFARIGLRNDEPLILSIFDKAIAAITDEERENISNRWLGLKFPPVSADFGTRVNLTAGEHAWLKAHPEIVLGAPTDYPPMVIKGFDGTHVGVLVDLFEQISRYLKTRVRLHIEDSWANIQEKAQKREIDGLAFGGRDASRDALYNATDIVVSTYFSVFARSQDEYQLKRFLDIDGMRIGYKKGARPTKSLLEKLPSAILKPYDGHESLTQALLNREIDVIVAWMSYDHWRKEKLQGTIDKILLIDEYPIEMVTYIRNDWPELIPILNKTIAALQQDELPRIINKWFGEWPRKSEVSRLILTPEEQAWLAYKHTVRVRIVDWPPYLILKGNEPPQGIVIDYLKLIEERTGITFKNEVTDQPFAEFLESMKRDQGPDMTAVIMRTPEREQYLSFTDHYITSPYVIFIREQDNPILDINGLAGKTLAVPRGFVVQEQLERDYPEISLALFDSDEKALQALATGKSDAYIGNLTVASHIIHGRGFYHLKVTAAGPFGDQAFSMGIRKSWPELTSIINKALASFTEAEKTTIRNRYLAIKYEPGINRAKVLRWVLSIVGVGLGIAIIFLLWNRQLSREIIKRKQTEEHLKRAKDEAEAANQAKSVFLANMSHELRTPLNAILGFSRMLAREQTANENQQEKLTVINRSGEHLLAMINDVLDLSKIEAGRVELEFEVFDLPRTLEDIGKIFELRAQKTGLRFRLSLDAELPRYVKADVDKLRQILNNLLSNALKFTDEGGVSLRARSTPMPADPAMLRLQVEVEDSGHGISPELQEHIFEPFYQVGTNGAGSKGTGLGLSISKSFVEMMGGQISIDSTSGKGSLFRIEVPVALAEAAGVSAVGSAGSAVLGLAPGQPTRRILVVEDNRENRLLLSSLLCEAGFEIREAENGKETIDLFEQWQPHLIWMDMRMPVMDGYEATRRIRNLAGGKAVKIVAITASAFREQRQDILAAGCDEVVYKPFRDHEIFETMARLLDIEYLYEERGKEVTPQEKIHLSAEMLAGLPDEWLQELRETALVLNLEAIQEVIGRIAEQAPDTAENLRALVKNFQIDRIQELLEEVENKD